MWLTSICDMNIPEISYFLFSLDDGDNRVLEFENASFIWKEKDELEISASEDTVRPFELKNMSMFVEKV